MKQYHDLLRDVLDNGVEKSDRTGTGTLSVFGRQLRFPLAKGFPLATTKKVFFKGLAVEMLWFIGGGTDTAFLHEHGVTIWDPWADENGALGPIYGKQWRDWETASTDHVDQLTEVVQGLRSNPHSRRHLVSAWNVADLPRMALPPCHVLYQFYVEPPAEGEERGRLSTHLYVRSNDLFLGAPFNIAQYALLTHLVADQTGLNVGDLVYTIGDAHVYLNHLNQVREQLSREPRPLPRLELKRQPPSIDGYVYDDFRLIGYDPHPSIKAPVAI